MLTVVRLHSIVEKDGTYSCRRCPASASSVMALARIPCRREGEATS